MELRLGPEKPSSKKHDTRNGQIGLFLSDFGALNLDKVRPIQDIDPWQVGERWYNKNMKLEKAVKRDRKRSKRNKMQVDGKSVFVIQETLIKKGKKKEKKNDRNWY